jgi:phage gp29-like protein
MAKTGIWISPQQFVEFDQGQKPFRLTDEIATRQRSPDFFAVGTYLPDPDPVLRKLGSDIRIYRELLSDPRVGACAESRKSAVLSLNWELEKGKAKSRIAKFVEDMLADLDLTRIMNEILNAPLFGFQTLEIMWKRVGQMIVPENVWGKPQEWFCFDLQNQHRFRTKENMMLGELLPYRKFLLAQHNPSYADPYGERVLSRVFWSVAFKKGSLKFWVTCAEKFGMPYLVGKHPRGTQTTEIEDLANMLQDMAQDAVAVIPDDSSVEILEAGGKGASSSLYKDLKQACDNDIAIAICGQNLTTEVKGGSLAAAEVHQQVRREIRDGDRRIVVDCIQQLIDWTVELNFGPGAEKPQYGLYEDEEVDKALADRDGILAATGQVKFTKEYFVKAYGFSEDDIEIAAPTPAPTPGAPGKPGSPVPPIPNTSEVKGAAAFAEARVPYPDQAALDDLVASLDPSALQGQMDGLLKPVKDLILNASDFAEIEQGLAAAYPDMADDQLTEQLARAIFLSDVVGRLSAQGKFGG